MEFPDLIACGGPSEREFQCLHSNGDAGQTAARGILHQSCQLPVGTLARPVMRAQKNQEDE